MGTLVTWAEFTSGGRPQGGTIREIVFPDVVNVISKRRPLMSLLANSQVDGLYVERLEDTLRARAHNAWVEGVDHTNPNLTQPSRLDYHVQRFAEFGQVTDEQRDTAHYNEDPFTYQMAKSMQLMLNDVELALHRGSAATGATNAARQLEGLLNIGPGQLTWTTDASGTTFTERVFIDILQSARDNKYDVDLNSCFVNSRLKRSISEFSTKITRNVDASEKMQTLVVERHSSDFGDVDIFYAEDQLIASSMTNAGNSVAIIDRSQFKKGWFKAPTAEVLARGGFSDKYQLTAMLTLLYGTKKAVGGGTGYVANVTL